MLRSSSASCEPAAVYAWLRPFPTRHMCWTPSYFGTPNIVSNHYRTLKRVSRAAALTNSGRKLPIGPKRRKELVVLLWVGCAAALSVFQHITLPSCKTLPDRHASCN